MKGCEILSGGPKEIRIQISDPYQAGSIKISV